MARLTVNLEKKIHFGIPYCGSPNKGGRWRSLLRESLTTSEDFSREFGLDRETIQKVLEVFPARINPYFKELLIHPSDPLGRQVIPDPLELDDANSGWDPLGERNQSPAPRLLHRYPDRVVLLASDECAVYCRFCNRKRIVGRGTYSGPVSLRKAMTYIRAHQEIRDVLLSGGDPLLLADGDLYRLLRELREMKHVEIIRIGTRVPGTLPQRVTHRLCRILSRFHPIFISVHFNHPRELTPESLVACEKLANAGIPLGSHTVLLRGVNDDPQVMLDLMMGLVMARVKPYYLFQLDRVRGSAHFWTPPRIGIEISRFLMERLPLEWVPHFVIDLPGGGGKVPLGPTTLGCSWV